MKKRELEKKLSSFGWRFLRQGGNHEAWTNGEFVVWLPRHNEIKEFTAQAIIKMAEKNTKRG